MNEAKIKIVKFSTLTTVLSKVGGFNASILAIFSLFYYVSWNMFVDTLARDLNKKDKSDERKNKIVRRIKTRLSYVNLYHLFDEVQS